MTSRQRQESPRRAWRGPALHLVPDAAEDENDPPNDVARLRAIAQITALGVSEWPPYGSFPWLRLPADDPRVYVATLEAAELHRTHIERLYAGAYEQAEHHIRTAADALAARRETTRTREPHRLTATPGWPPIQIPGRPGEYLTYQGNE